MTESKNGNICIFYVAPPNLDNPGKEQMHIKHRSKNSKEIRRQMLYKEGAIFTVQM